MFGSGFFFKGFAQSRQALQDDHQKGNDDHYRDHQRAGYWMNIRCVDLIHGDFDGMVVHNYKGRGHKKIAPRDNLCFFFCPYLFLKNIQRIITENVR